MENHEAFSVSRLTSSGDGIVRVDNIFTALAASELLARLGSTDTRLEPAIRHDLIRIAISFDRKSLTG